MSEFWIYSVCISARIISCVSRELKMCEAERLFKSIAFQFDLRNMRDLVFYLYVPTASAVLVL